MIGKLSFVASCLAATVAAIGASHRPGSGFPVPAPINGVNSWNFPRYEIENQQAANGTYKQWEGLCQTGMQQSPINVITSDANERFGNYQLRASGFRNMDHKLLIADNHELWMEIDDGLVWATDAEQKRINYKPFEISIKTPSEHHIDGIQYDVEIQIPMTKIGKTEGSVNAVMSIFLDHARAFFHNDFVESINCKLTSRHSRCVGKDIKLNDFMQSLDVSTYFEYAGSLTQPPCTEGVQWFILPHIKSLSKRQQKSLNELFVDERTSFSSWVNTDYGNQGKKQGNNREIQRQNGRKVYLSHNKDFPNPNEHNDYI